jgi:chitodextrinase
VSRRYLYVLLAAVLAAIGVAFALPSAHAATNFVSRNGANFDLNGQPFRYGGANNYYLHYKSNLMVDDVFSDAQAMGLKVIRAWTFLECGGDKPGANGLTCDSQGTNVWMQRWSNAANGGAGGVVYNETQLTAIDRMIASASAHGIKLILPFAGNWRDFGGMDQYVAWYGLQFHDQFYTDTRIQQDYKNWISKLVNRVNTVTGVAYKNDPTIFAWELANEPRCIDAAFPTSGTCTADTLVNWATTMSAFIKSLDSNHMVSVGDEGFHPGPPPPTSQQWPYNITDGVDHARLTAIPSIDFGTYHLYPQSWGQSPTDTWGTQWINDHNAVGASVNKPEILEEFGTTDQSIRDATYTAWTNAVRTGGGDGWNVWILTGIQDDGQLYPDFDGYRVVLPSSTATVLSNAAAQIGTGGGDTQAPTVPGAITTSGLTATSVNLAWGASTDNVGVSGYDIFRATGTTGTFASVGTSTTASFAATGLTASTTYRFEVRARDAAGNTSAFNTPVTVTTSASADTTAPTVPGTITTSGLTATSVNLAWGASTDNVGVTGYDIFRATGGGAFASFGTSTTTSFAATGLTAATTYQFEVRARDAAGNTSAFNTPVSVTTSSSGDTQAPTVPGAVTSSGVTATSVNLAWGASTDNVGVTGYDIFRATGTTGTFASVGTSTTTSFAATGLTASTTYRFEVRARDAAGNTSAFNTPVTVTTSAGGGTGGCSATLPVQSQWSGGYVVQAVTTNTSTSTINAWTVTFTLPAGQTITNSWNVSLTVSGTTVTAHNLSYNGTTAPNGTQGWGFQASRAASDNSVASNPTCTPS